MEYLNLNSLNEITKNHLLSYWGRKNRLAIVEFPRGHCLVFLVEDLEKPQIPGYSATGIEYFRNHKKAVEAVKNCYDRIGYIPKYADRGNPK